MNAQLTQQQIWALQQFARVHGRTWKSALRARWERGNWLSDEYASDLQTLRNTHGPSWLARFRMPERKHTRSNPEHGQEAAGQVCE
jgi:hypothetical protein